MGKGKLDKLPKGKLIAYFKIGIYIYVYICMSMCWNYLNILCKQ